jgi:hypothetical protein
LWPVKPANQLRAITGASLRTCKYWLAGRHDPSFADLIALLRSEDGFAVLQHLMADARPAWWRGIVRAKSLSRMRKELEEQRRRIEQLELELD